MNASGVAEHRSYDGDPELSAEKAEQVESARGLANFGWHDGAHYVVLGSRLRILATITATTASGSAV
jgi:hypothetical protein